MSNTYSARSTNFPDYSNITSTTGYNHNEFHIDDIIKAITYCDFDEPTWELTFERYEDSFKVRAHMSSCSEDDHIYGHGQDEKSALLDLIATMASILDLEE